MEMLFLTFVNETTYLLWNLPYFKMVPPKTKLFSFLKPWADNSQQTSAHVNCFMARDDALCAVLSQKCILWDRGLEKLPQPRGISFI